MIAEIISPVDHTQLFRDVAYEWEEEAAKYFDVPIRQIPKPHDERTNKSRPGKLRTLAKRLFPALSAAKQYIEISALPTLRQNLYEPLSLCFLIYISDAYLLHDANVLPVFFDVWNDRDFNEVIHLTKNLRLFYVTSIDVYNRIKIKSPQSNVRYMPLSISDEYYSENFTDYRSKIIDVFMPGRGNPVLHKYMLDYAAEHRDISYVYRRENWECRSTDGTIVMSAANRAGYMNILASSKVSIVGCSGIDNARENANGICFVTPRFYESAVMGCALIGRWPDNQEFRELNMSRVCPNITSYEQFTSCLERALAQTPEELYAQNHDFIINSLTSVRAKQIQDDLNAVLAVE